MIDLTKIKTAFVKITWDESGKKKIVFLEQWSGATVKSQSQIDSHFKTQNAGIAVLTGKENGLTVIDFDTKNNELLLELLAIAPTYCVETKKGYHLYYQYRDDPILKEGTDRFTGGVDVRNDKGLIFAPPTPNYSVWGDETVNELSDEAMEALRLRVKQPGKKDLITTTTRNDSLFRMACAWINLYPKEEVFRRMAEANKKFIKGELDLEEIETIYQQASKYDPRVKEAEKQEEKKKEIEKYTLNFLSETPDEGEEVRYKTGFAQFDILIRDEDAQGGGGLALGEFVAIAGRPKNGKTLFTAQVASSLAKQGLPILWLFYEGKQAKLKKVVSKAGAPDGSVVIIECEKGQPLVSRVDWIGEQLKRAQDMFGIKVLVIDNLDFLEIPDGMKNNGEYEAMKIIVTALAKMAVQYNIILLLVAHVRKPTNTGGSPRRPYMYDIAGTSQVDRLCDVGFIVDRDKQSDGVFLPTTSIYLENNRPMGEQRKIECTYRDGRLVDAVDYGIESLGGKITQLL